MEAFVWQFSDFTVWVPACVVFVYTVDVEDWTIHITIAAVSRCKLKGI